MPSDAREAVLHGEMHAATRRLERVVNHLLDMTRIESAQVKPHMEWCDLEEVIHDTLQHTGLPGDGHDVRVHLPADLPPLYIDPVLTETMLANLLHNAAVWNDRAQPIEVSVEVSGDSWLLKVRDHGPGIPADLLPRIFEKFTRADGAPAGGTGLGLSIVRGFAKAQGATIHAENAVPHGAVFIIRFPLSTPSL